MRDVRRRLCNGREPPTRSRPICHRKRPRSLDGLKKNCAASGRPLALALGPAHVQGERSFAIDHRFSKPR